MRPSVISSLIAVVLFTPVAQPRVQGYAQSCDESYQDTAFASAKAEGTCDSEIAYRLIGECVADAWGQVAGSPNCPEECPTVQEDGTDAPWPKECEVDQEEGVSTVYCTVQRRWTCVN